MEQGERAYICLYTYRHGSQVASIPAGDGAGREGLHLSIYLDMAHRWLVSRLVMEQGERAYICLYTYRHGSQVASIPAGDGAGREGLHLSIYLDMAHRWLVSRLVMEQGERAYICLYT